MGPVWFKDHFINLKADTVNFMPYQHISASLVAFYSWEVIANRYGRLTWSVLVHHWLTAGIAAAILLGRYTPFATWYGFCLVSMDFPVFFTLGFRAQFSNKYPSFTRKAFVFSFWWWTFILILNVTGQLYIIFNSLINHYNESIHISFIIIMGFMIFAWLYDDIQLLRGLYDFSTHNYEDAEILNSEKRSMSRNLGGRALFAMSVIHDIETVKEKEDVDGGGNETKIQTLKHVTLHQLHSTPLKDKNDENAKLKKQDSLSHDEMMAITEEIDEDNVDSKIELQSKSPASPSGILTKISGIDTEDFTDLVEIQKEEMDKMKNNEMVD